MKHILSIKNVRFAYGQDDVVRDFSLDVDEGSFTTLLGSSGCGKTTLLRLVSGFLEPDSGGIFIDGADQRGIEPNKRSVGMVFQDYALFPHLSVEKNIAYGLKIKKLSRAEIAEEVREVAANLGISDLLSRLPSELSGGQQQRVALARAVVLKPRILLMDEPLSSLDSLLRERVRTELKDIQRRLGITTLYVTHDQDEALSLSDKIAVIDSGVLQQCGSPKEVYFRPVNRFVANFVGRANFIAVGGELSVVRPEWFSVAGGDGSGECGETLRGKIDSAEFLGGTTRLSVRTDSGDFVIADVPTLSCDGLESGSRVSLSVTRRVPLP